MITLKENVLRTADAFSQENWPGSPPDTGAPADSALLATLKSRLHCRTPMKRVDRGELPVRELVSPDGRRTPVTSGKNRAPVEVATYRCMCGFTMDVPPAAAGYAAAN